MSSGETIRERVAMISVDGLLPCARAFSLADDLGIDPLEVGDTATESDIRVSRCQLGLFGYGPKSEGRHRIVQPAKDVSTAMRQAIESRLENGRLPCESAWRAAKALAVSKMEVSAAAEAMGVRVSRCQLGCF